MSAKLIKSFGMVSLVAVGVFGGYFLGKRSEQVDPARSQAIENHILGSEPMYYDEDSDDGFDEIGLSESRVTTMAVLTAASAREELNRLNGLPTSRGNRLGESSLRQREGAGGDALGEE